MDKLMKDFGREKSAEITNDFKCLMLEIILKSLFVISKLELMF
jgi:hypothetical protein